MLKDPQRSVGTTMCWRPTVAFAFAGEFDSDVAAAAASSVFVSSLSDILQFRSTKMKRSCKSTCYCVLWSQVKAPQFSLFFFDDSATVCSFNWLWSVTTNPTKKPKKFQQTQIKCFQTNELFVKTQFILSFRDYGKKVTESTSGGNYAKKMK